MRELLPAAGGWEFSFEPSIEKALGLRDEPQTLRAAAPEEIGALISGLAGLRFRFGVPLRGGSGWVEHHSPQGVVRVQEVDVGPVLWRATGARLERYGKREVFGGGKIALYCEHGLFQRVLLSPLSFR